MNSGKRQRTARSKTAENLDLDARAIPVAEFLTGLPPRSLLKDRLHRAIEAPRNHFVREAKREGRNK
jgi:hypothetical protein